MARQRFFNMPAKAREKLLRLAIEEFAERGFEDASLNEILAKAGISKGAYYYYFDDKEDLLATALEGIVDSAAARLPSQELHELGREEFWPAIERSLGGWLDAFDSLTPVLRAMRFVTEARRRSPRFAPVLAKAQSHWRTLIEAGQRAGCVRTDLPNDLLVRLVEANDQVLDSVLLDSQAKWTRASLLKHLRVVLDTMRRLLAVDGPAAWRGAPRKRRAVRRA